MNISLPPGVSFRKDTLQGCQAYVFRHVELGEVRLRVGHRLGSRAVYGRALTIHWKRASDMVGALGHGAAVS